METQKMGNVLKSNLPPLEKDGSLVPWDDDPTFKHYMNGIGYPQHTILEPVRCFMLYQLALRAMRCTGVAAEVGVYLGGTSLMLGRIFHPLKFYAFDTFKGIPPGDPDKDYIMYGFGDANDTSFDREAILSFITQSGNVEPREGFFPDTARGLEDKEFCFVHVDADIYPSIKACCEFFYPRMSRGGIMVFDDYGFNVTPGAKIAVDEFFANKPEMGFYLQGGQKFFIKM
jgi:O-methyltransferase